MSLYKHTSEDCLPGKLPVGIRRERITISEFGGAKSLPGCEGTANLSPRRLPAIATRRPRGVLSAALGSGTPHGMANFEGDLYFVRGTALYRMGTAGAAAIGTVSDTDKVFYVFGDRLYIFPDKLYMEAGGTALMPMELDSGVVGKSTFKGSTVTLPEGMGWTALGFTAGDCLRVVNADDDMPAPEGYYRIMDIRGRTATVQGTFPATYESSAYFRRVVPDMERVCVSGDRVYGVAGKDVYVSGAGRPLDFYSKGASDGSDAVTLRVDSDGEITACAAWQGYVVLFKSDRICKLLGTRADSFTLQERPAVGISAPLSGTLCEVGGDLYYLAESGVYRYRGQEPERISPVMESGVKGGCGGTDGAAYYLAVQTLGEEEWHQYCYLPERGEWFDEGTLHPKSMVCRKGFLCIQDVDGYLWLTSSDGRETYCAETEFSVVGPVRAEITLPPDYGFQPGGCRLVGVSLRVTGGDASALYVSADYADGAAGEDADGTRQVSVGLVSGNITDRLLRFPVAPRPCDAVRLRIAMAGDWVIHSVIKEYERSGQ